MLDQKAQNFRSLKNRFLLNYSYLRRETLSRGLPHAMYVEPTNRCNIECVICPRPYMKRKEGDMSFSQFKAIIDQSSDFLEFVHISGLGEPLLNKEIFRMINYCHNNNIKSAITTNIINLTEEVSLELCKANLDYILLSLDALDNKTYNIIKKNGDFEQVIENIHKYLHIDHMKRPYTIIQIVESKYNTDQVHEFKRKWRGERNIDKVKVKPEVTWTKYKESVNSPSKNRNPVTKNHCIWPWRELSIDWEGNVFPCCTYFIEKGYMGNVNNESISDIWNNKNMVDFRRRQLESKGDIYLCNYCPEFAPHPLLTFLSFPISGLSLRKVATFMENITMKKKKRVMIY